MAGSPCNGLWPRLSEAGWGQRAVKVGRIAIRCRIVPVVTGLSVLRADRGRPAGGHLGSPDPGPGAAANPAAYRSVSLTRSAKWKRRRVTVAGSYAHGFPSRDSWRTRTRNGDRVSDSAPDRW